MRRFIIACVVASALTVGVAVANDTMVNGSGGSVKPEGSPSIQMQAESVQAIMHGGFAEYQVDFRFVNRGKPQRVKLGFPFQLPDESGNDYAPPASVRAWKNGRPLAVTYSEGKDGPYRVAYYVHDVTFPTGATMIRVSYYVAPANNTGTAPPDAKPPRRFAGSTSFNAWYPYTVHTGAGWAGAIDLTVIRYTLSPDFLGWGAERATADEAASQNQDVPGAKETWLSYTKPSANTYQWTYRNYNPKPTAYGLSKYDMALYYYRPSRGEFEGKVPSWDPAAKTEASSWLKLGDYWYQPEAATDGDPSTAWAEKSGGPGTGEWLKVTFGGSRTVREIRVLPGYAKTTQLFRKYNRPKTLKVEFSDGTVKTIELADKPELQRFPLPKTTATSAKVTVTGVYRGTNPRNELYLSEIEFGTAAAPTFASFTSLTGIPVAEATKPETASPEPTATSPATTAAAPTGGTGSSATSPTPPGSGRRGNGNQPGTWLLLAAAGAAAVAAVAGAVAWTRRRKPPAA